MAGDWIKLEVVTPDKPEVSRIATSLSIDHDAALGKLVRVWIWADLQTIDGNAVGVTKSAIDRIAYMPGFADAMISVGWISGDDEALCLVGFDKHNGKGAKKRALTNQRVADHRKNATLNGSGCNAGSVNESVTRDREENIESKELANDESLTSEPKPSKKVDPVPYSLIIESYRKCLPDLPQPEEMTPKRKAGARSIWKQYKKSHEPDFWDRYFTYVGKQEFLCNMKGIGINWLLNFENMCKVIEGNYE